MKYSIDAVACLFMILICSMVFVPSYGFTNPVSIDLFASTSVRGNVPVDSIPKAVKVTRDGRRLLPVIERQFLLNDLTVGVQKEIFAAPPCLQGQYYVGIQLVYDVGDRNTQTPWSAAVEVAFQRSTTTLWKKPLQVDMGSQTFATTVFHDTTVFCSPDYKIQLTQKNLTGTVPPNTIYLKVLLYKYQENTFTAATPLTLNYSLVDNQGTVSWTYPDDAALEYDIEWVFIADHESFTGTAQQAFAFKEPVRVTVAGQHYQHLVYYPKGRLWYRARAVGTHSAYPKHRIPGQWFYGTATPLAIANHQTDKNWQQQTIFTEEGKYKKVMSYYDGSLRSRQVLTNLSSEKLTLVGENLYDFEGRKALDILAVPSADASLKYHAGFHIFQAKDTAVAANTSATRMKFNYDNHRLENSILSDQVGAAHYFSPVHTLSGIHTDYLPDSKGYVYSQTEYLRDGTGRPVRQSQVGESFGIDGSHATRYHYGEASPAELVRLFGSQVGKAVYYKKNLVVDANGQVSVSYVDPQNQTIATALAGDAPANVEGIASYKQLPVTPITVDLDAKNRHQAGVSRTIHKLLNVNAGTNYTFRYRLDALASDLGALGCIQCQFDLNITITDPDGKRIAFPAIVGNESADGLSYERKGLSVTDCSVSTALQDISFTLTLADLGDYTVSKVLTPYELSYDEMSSIVTADETVLQKIQAIYDSYPVDSSACAICSDCPEAEAAIDKAIEEVTAKDCENIYQQIIQYYQDTYGTGSEQVYTVPQDSIQAHPLYCQYLICQKNQPSEIFEKQLSRINTWEAAVSKNYQNLIQVDPFFTNSTQSGYYAKAGMQALLNDIVIGTIPYDSNGDGVQDGTKTYRGTLLQVTDPTNTAYYIDSRGNANINGRHILYQDLMSRKSRMTPSTYQTELSQQRWTLYKSFYREAKRKTKLTLAEYQNCAAAKKDLEQPDTLPLTEAGIIAYGDQQGATGPVGDAELEMSLYNITSSCGIKLSAADSSAIVGHLRTYFNSNKSNFFRLLFQTDLGIHSSLVAIQNLLNPYACSLTKVAVENPVSCVSEPANWVVNPSLSATNPNCSPDISESCYPGWGVATGTPNTNQGGGSGQFLIWATAGNRTSEAIRGSFISPLQVGVKYELCLKYQVFADAQTYTSGKVDEVYWQLSRSKAFVNAQGNEVTSSAQLSNRFFTAPLASRLPVDSTSAVVSPIQGARTQALAPICILPTAKYPDPVVLEGQTTPVTKVWKGTNLSNVSTYKDTCIVFTPTQASTYFYVSIMSCTNGVYQAVNIKDIRLRRILPNENSVNFQNKTICLRYDTTNATLGQFTYQVDWKREVQLCLDRAQEERNKLIDYAVEHLLDEEVTSFYTHYRSRCLESSSETLSYTYQPKEYHYTLYYYDQAGNLVQTVPPQGVQPLTSTQVRAFLAGSRTEPSHTLVTQYQYNALNQLIWQKTPDAGESRFWYNDQGQLRLSQNNQQQKESRYAYSKYDSQGRIIEGGELQTTAALSTLVNGLENPSFPQATASFVCTDQVWAYYDQSKNRRDFTQENLRTRVSYSAILENGRTDTVGTYYSYDRHGNVKSVLQVIPGLKAKRMDYLYDQLSGKVNYAFYQYNQPDQLVHRYAYDSDNRLTEVYTSTDRFVWNKEAAYRYYLHGPLARVELGHYRVQGLDYNYTLQGWLKGVNMPDQGDPGKDGRLGSKVGKDVMAYTLGYYQGDYQPVSSTVNLAENKGKLWTRLQETIGHTGLYNGNISWMITDLVALGERVGQRATGMQAMLYGYDQLNRLVKSRSLTQYQSANGFAARVNTALAYDEDYQYDANGNILTLKRMNEQGGLMDDFSYQYYAGSNRLKEVKPVLRDTVYRSGPIQTNHKLYRNITLQAGAYAPVGSQVRLNAEQNIFVNPDFKAELGADFYAHVLDDTEGTFLYDGRGNLVADQDQGMRIRWTPSGKVREVRSRIDSVVIRYQYNALGQRIEKTVIRNNQVRTTRYVADATGNVMAVYADTLVVEQYIYGSTRLGVYKGGIREGSRQLGARQYELSNHLGNVLAVITDNVGMQTDSVWARVVSHSDYYPFGLFMKGRTYSDTTYRYGFNGKENDNEWSKIDFGGRGYDARLGRWMSTDPQEDEFPGFSPYNYSLNSPLMFVDPDGESPISIFAKMALKQGIRKAATEFIESQIKKRIADYAGKKILSKAFAKTLARDADAILETLDTEWWEYVIEVTPVAGDLYGGAKLTKQGIELWQKIKRLEKKLDKFNDALQDSRGKLKKSFESGSGKKVVAEYAKKGFQAHHIIPVGILQKNEYLQEAVAAGWDINGRLNGKMLKQGFHTNHRTYNDFVDQTIGDWGDEFKRRNGRMPTGAEVSKYLNTEFLPSTNQMIDQAREIYDKGGKNRENSLNNFFKSLGF